MPGLCQRAIKTYENGRIKILKREALGEDLSLTSESIAVSQKRQARSNISTKKKNLQLRAEGKIHDFSEVTSVIANKREMASLNGLKLVNLELRKVKSIFLLAAAKSS